MSYSINRITQIVDRDVLLSWAQNEKSDLSFKKLSEERLKQNYSIAAIVIDAVKG